MIHRFLVFGATAALMTILALSAPYAHDYRAGAIAIDHPWSRATAPTATTGAGYMALTNEGTEDDRLMGAATDIAGRVELHRTEITDGVMRMREQEDGIAVPAGETVVLEPGGYHVMFMALKRPLAAGESVPVTLTFERGGSVTVEVAVVAVGSRPDGMDHGNMDHGTMDHGTGSGSGN